LPSWPVPSTPINQETSYLNSVIESDGYAGGKMLLRWVMGIA
jgi:hypothetical protein